MAGVAHVKISAAGEFNFIEPVDVTVEVNNGKIHHPISENSIPPIVSGVKVAVSKIFSGALGKLGKGMDWFIFDSSEIDNCEKGKFWIVYRDERYEYVTPIPGCSDSLAGK